MGRDGAVAHDYSYGPWESGYEEMRMIISEKQRGQWIKDLYKVKDLVQRRYFGKWKSPGELLTHRNVHDSSPKILI